MLTLLGAAGLLAAMAVVVPLLAYGLSALVDRITRGRDDGHEGRGGTLVPRKPKPSGPSTPMTRSAEPGKDRDGTVS